MQANRVDAVFRVAGGGELGGGFFGRAAAAVGEVDAPELHRGAVGELETITREAHAAVFSRRFFQPILHSDDAGAERVRRGEGKPIRPGHRPREPIKILLPRQEGDLVRQGNRQRDRARTGGKFVLGEEHAEILVEGHPARRVEGERDVARLFKA